MSPDTADNSSDDALYMIPLTQLELDANLIEYLQAAGVVSVGDLVDIACLLRYATVSMPSEMMAIMNGEVKEKLREQGYWAYVEDN